MADGYVVVGYPPTPIPVGGFVQSPTGVLVPFAKHEPPDIRTTTDQMEGHV